MPFLRVPILPHGPIVQFFVGVSRPLAERLRQSKQPIPNPVQVTAGLIDTGASLTAVVPSILQPLGLVATGRAPVHTPSTDATGHECDMYDVSLIFPLVGSSFMIPALPILEMPRLEAQGLQALIGRDVIGRAHLTYDGPGRLLTIGF